MLGSVGGGGLKMHPHSKFWVDPFLLDFFSPGETRFGPMNNYPGIGRCLPSVRRAALAERQTQQEGTKYSRALPGGEGNSCVLRAYQHPSLDSQLRGPRDQSKGPFPCAESPWRFLSCSWKRWEGSGKMERRGVAEPRALGSFQQRVGCRKA